MTIPGGDLPVRRARQMDLALAAGLTHRDLDVLIAARHAWHDRQRSGGSHPIRVGYDDDSGEPPELVGERLLRAAIAKPGALLFDAVLVRALRRERAR